MRFWGGKSKEVPRRRAIMSEEDDGNKFRRGRSLTGSLVDEISAPAEQKGQLQSARVEAQNKRQKRQYFLRRLASVALIIFGLYGLYAHRVSSFEITFASQLQKKPEGKAYIASAQQFVSQSFGNQFSISLNRAELANYLMQQHTEINNVQIITAPFDATPQIIINLRKPVVIWQTKQDPTPFYVDASGTSFAFDGWGAKGLVPINDESGATANLGGPVASSRQISFLGQFVGHIAQTSGNKLVINKIVFPPSSTKEVNVYVKDKPYFAKVYLERSPRAQAEAVVKGVKEFEARGVAPAEYMDVRVPEKIFYK